MQLGLHPTYDIDKCKDGANHEVENMELLLQNREHFEKVHNGQDDVAGLDHAKEEEAVACDVGVQKRTSEGVGQ